MRPNSGGGSRRTFEINRRLSDEFDITVVTARFKGCRDRVEDGIRYRHVGIGPGYYINVVSYHLALPWVITRTDADLIIEDFASPISSVAAPVWTRRPSIAIVQWLFAHETSRQYHVPFFVLEAFGIRTHRRFIAVSRSIAQRVRDRNPSADVTVIPNGIADEMIGACTPERRENYILYLGRLQFAAKGLDKLLAAFDAVATQSDVHLIIAGGGPDERAVRDAVRGSRWASRITLTGWVDGERKRNLLDGAKLVVVPSQYESFAIVAVEAMAAGAPVVGFDIPALAELVGSDRGILVAPGDARALADAIAALLDDDHLRSTMATAGQEFAQRFSWSESARLQGDVIRSVLQEAGVREAVPS